LQSQRLRRLQPAPFTADLSWHAPNPVHGTLADVYVHRLGGERHDRARRPAGSVNFYLDGVIDSAHLLGTAPIHAGTARVTLPNTLTIVPGTHTVTAVYAGDTFYNTSATSFTIAAR
jgi:hypothetical protein